MTIQLPSDLTQSIEAALSGGRFRSVEDLVSQAVRSFLDQPAPAPADPLLGSIGFMSDAAAELDEIVADAYRLRREEPWRELGDE